MLEKGHDLISVDEDSKLEFGSNMFIKKISEQKTYATITSTYQQYMHIKFFF